MAVFCDCGYEAPTGCTCGFADTESIAWNGVAGQPAQRQPVAVVDPRLDNLLSGGVGGLFAELPERFRDPPAVRVYRSTTQGIADDVETPVSFDTTVFDTSPAMFNGSELFVVRTAGLFTIAYSGRWGSDADGFREASLLIDGGAVVRDRFHVIATGAVANNVGALWYCPLGTEISFTVRHTAGGTISLQAAGATTTNSYNTVSIGFFGDIL